MLPPVQLTIIGAGAIGGTIGAHLLRAGHDVLLCDADPAHVEAINARGLRIEGPVEEFSVRAKAVLPRDLPPSVDRARHRGEVPPHRGRGRPAPGPTGTRRLRPVAAERAQRRRDRRGSGRRAGAARLRQLRGGLPGTGRRPAGQRCHLPGRRAVGPGHGPGPRVGGCRCPGPRPPTTSPATCGRKEAYGAMLFATAVSDLTIADALDDARLPPADARAGAGGAGPGPRASRGVRRLRPRRPRGFDRPVGRLQPGQRQVAQRHLPGPDGAPAQDRGRRPARRPRRAAHPLRRGAGPRHRARRADLRGGQPGAARRLRAARAARAGRCTPSSGPARPASRAPAGPLLGVPVSRSRT